MASCHFNLFMNELGIKVRGAISTAIYRLFIAFSVGNSTMYRRLAYAQNNLLFPRVASSHLDRGAISGPFA
jgi:hypothetical protein